MKPFAGIRVLDLTHVLAGPFSTFQLACLGADVIKIESPNTPDMTRTEGVETDRNRELYGSYFQSQNASKRAITINLKTQSGKDLFWRLIKTADVLVQNYTGDTLEKLGFGYAAVSEVNPKIIYCSISGFGATGPKANHPAYDVVIQAFSGLMACNGEANSDPVRVGPPMVDYGTGAQAALAISSALYQRQQTNQGQFIDVAMLDAALMMMSAFVVDTVITNDRPLAHGNAHPSYAGYATYDTADGQLMIGAWTNKQFAALLDVLDEPVRAREVTETDRQDVGAYVHKDKKLIAQKMLAKPAHIWEELLNDAHVPAARVRTLDETLQEPQLKHRQVLQPLQDIAKENTNENLEGCPERFPVTAFSYAHGTPSIESPPPRLGQHTTDVLQELGYSEDEISTLSEQGAI